VFIIIIILGVTQYVSGFYGYTLFILAIITLTYYLKCFEVITIKNKFIEWMIKLIALIFMSSIGDKLILNMFYIEKL